MIKEFRKHIGVKLFVLLASLIAIAIVPTTYVVFSTFSYLGQYIAEVNRDEIKNQAQSYQALIAREQAHKYDDFFSHVEVAASLMAAEAREVYNNLDYYAGFPDSQLGFVRDGESGMMNSLPGHGVPTVFKGEAQLSAAMLREMQALLRLDPVFKGVQQEIPASDAIHIETMTGISRYLGRVQEDSGSAKGGTLKSEYRQRLGLASDFIATKPDAFADRTMWTKVYRGAGDGNLLITASCPVVDSKGVLRATIGLDISLENIMKDLLNTDANRYENQGREMQFSFLLDDSGRIIAFPQEHLGLFGLNVENGRRQAGDDSLGLYLADSMHAVIPPIVPQLLGSATDVVGVKLENGTYILHAHTMHHLNWHLVLVTREAQSSPSVERTEQALSGALMLLVNKFIVNALFVVSIMLVVFFFAVGYFVKPLKRLSEAALLVGRGDLKTRCHLDREDELGILANSFNDMVRQLESAEKVQKNQAMQLELAVMERTRDLRNRNFALRDVISELNAESERRRQAVEALKKSEEQIRIVMDASLAGHGIIQDKRVTYVNSMASKIFGYSREEMTCGSFWVTELVTQGQYERAKKVLLESFNDKAGKPFLIECCRKDGSIFDALVGGAMTTWNGNSAVVVTVMDISDQKQTKEELRKSKMLLQSSLAEKDVLLREIYHRTKNNMLVIISMLHLQAMDIEDPKVKTLFWETENRIRAMSLVHEKLYQSQNLAEIDMGQYLEEMVTALVGSMVIGGHVKVEIECEHISVSIDNAVPMGLAINEIVTNSLKHAFPAGRTGRIFVRLCQDENGMVEVVAGDDGVGLPPDMDLDRVRSFGMQITVNLIEKQLHGTMDICREGGTVYRIMFKEPVRAKRV